MKKPVMTPQTRISSGPIMASPFIVTSRQEHKIGCDGAPRAIKKHVTVSLLLRDRQTLPRNVRAVKLDLSLRSYRTPLLSEEQQ